MGMLEKEEGPDPAGLVGQVKVFYLKNINKPMKSFKQRSDMIRFVFSSDYLDWNRLRRKQGEQFGTLQMSRQEVMF